MDNVLLILHLLVVKDIHKSDTVDTIFFLEGQKGQIYKTDKDYDYYIEIANESLNQKHPIGVSIAENDRIAEMVSADNDIVRILAEQDDERIKIWFWGHNGTFFLQRNHPNFKSIITLLNQSKNENKRIWFVFKPRLLLLDDVAIMESQDMQK